MDFLSYVTNQPQITIQDLLNKTKQNKIKKFSKQNTSPRDTFLKDVNVFDVKQPFYIDRYKQFLHKDCHIKGKCLACQYAELKPFNLKPNKPYLHPRRRYNNEIVKTNLRLKTQRQSQDNQLSNQNNLRRLRVSEGTQKIDYNILFKNIKLKLKYLDKQSKRLFEQTFRKNCDDAELADYIHNYLLNKQDENQNFLQFFSKIRNLNLKDLLISQQFLSYLSKRYQFSSKNTNSTATPQTNNKKSKINSVLTEVKFVSENIIQKKQKKLNKKIKFQEQLIKQQKNKANEVCNSFIIGNENDKQLNKQMKQFLLNLANQKYKVFKQVISSVDGFIRQKFNEDPTQHQKISLNVQMIAQWLKNYISPSDNNEDLKKYQVNKLVQSIQNMPKSKNRRQSLQKNTLNVIKPSGLSRFNDEQSGESQRQIKRIGLDKNKTKTILKKQMSINSQQQKNNQIIKISQKEIKDVPFHKSNRKYNNKMTEGTAKLIQQQKGDVVDCNELTTTPLIRKQSNRKSEINFGKFSFLKHSKQNESEGQQRAFFGRAPEFVTQNRQQTRKNIQYSNCENKKRQYQKSERQTDSYNNYVRINLQTSEQKFEIQSQKRRKILLKLRAAQLLKQNQQLIQKVELCLRKLDLSEYIINSTDCVLTQKKKIRALRDLIRLKSLSQLIQIDTINKILQYLSIYEQNCKILIEKCSNKMVNNQNYRKFDWKEVIGRRQILNQLLFYDLTSQFIYGKADEDEINYLFKNINKDKSWQISSKNINIPLNFNKIQADQIKTENKPKEQDLIQIEMSEICQTEQPQNKFKAYYNEYI